MFNKIEANRSASEGERLNPVTSMKEFINTII